MPLWPSRYARISARPVVGFGRLTVGNDDVDVDDALADADALYALEVRAELAACDRELADAETDTTEKADDTAELEVAMSDVEDTNEPLEDAILPLKDEPMLAEEITWEEVLAEGAREVDEEGLDAGDDTALEVPEEAADERPLAELAALPDGALEVDTTDSLAEAELEDEAGA